MCIRDRFWRHDQQVSIIAWQNFAFPGQVKETGYATGERAQGIADTEIIVLSLIHIWGGDGNSGSTGYATLNYRGGYGNANIGYSHSDDIKQLYYGDVYKRQHPDGQGSHILCMA